MKDINLSIRLTEHVQKKRHICPLCIPEIRNNQVTSSFHLNSHQMETVNEKTNNTKYNDLPIQTW